MTRWIYIYEVMNIHAWAGLGWIGLDWIGLDRIMIPGYQNTTLA